MAEQFWAQFHAPRCRAVSVDQVPIADQVHIAEEVLVTDAKAIDEMMAPMDPIAANDTPTGDVAYVMDRASTKESIQTSGTFSGGPSDRLLLTEYADHAAYKL